MESADLEASIWEGFKGGLHHYFAVRVAPVSTVILNLFGNLVLGELFVQARMLSGFLVFERSWPVAPDRDLRVGTVMSAIRAAMLEANMLRCSQDIRLLGRIGQLHPRSLLWSSKRPKAKYEKILVASKRRLVQKTDPRKLALSKLLQAF